MELFDILDEKGHPCGTTKERNAIHRDGDRHGSVHIWIISHSEVLVQKRAHDKESFPGCFDAACTGHICAGETPLAAAIRETKEELGIDIDEKNLEFLFTQELNVITNSFKSLEFNYVFALKEAPHRQELVFQESEIEFIEWQSASHIMSCVKNKDPEYCIIEEEYIKVLDFFVNRLKKTLYISDLDGTLLTPDAVVSDESAQIINSLASEGLHFSAATARTSATALKMLENIQLGSPVILMNGVCIFDTKTQKYIISHKLEKNALSGLIKAIEKNCSAGFLYCLKGEKLIAYYEKLTSPNACDFVKERITRFGKVFTQVSSFRECPVNDIIYFSISDKKEVLQPLYEDIKKLSGINCVFYRDVYNESFWYLEVSSDKASKKNALKYIKEAYGFSRAVSFGDNLNDLGLFEESNECYAVINAKEDVKKAASAVIGSNSENGVARWLENEFLLCRARKNEKNV